jgi:hypothetical protein
VAAASAWSNQYQRSRRPGLGHEVHRNALEQGVSPKGQLEAELGIQQNRRRCARRAATARPAPPPRPRRTRLPARRTAARPARAGAPAPQAAGLCSRA